MLDDKLIAKAKELGVEIKDDMTDEDLQSTISEKEKTNEENLSKEELLRQVKYYKSEMGKAIDKRDSERKLKRDALKKLEDLEDKLSGVPDKEEFDKLKGISKDYDDLKTLLEEEAENKKLKDASEVDRIKISLEKDFKNFQNETNKKVEGLTKELTETKEESKGKDAKIASMARRGLMSAIKSVAAENNALNPTQIVKMTLNEFTWNEQLQDFEHVEYDKNGKETNVLSVEEYVKDFLEDETNANLVKASDTGDGLETKTTTTTTKKIEKKASDTTDKYSPKHPSIIAGAEERGLTPEVYAGIKKKEDIAYGRLKKEDAE